MTQDQKIPKHIIKRYGSARRFRACKRYHVATMRFGMKALRDGCAYAPAGSWTVDEVGRLLDILADAYSVKRWGR